MPGRARQFISITLLITACGLAAAIPVAAR